MTDKKPTERQNANLKLWDSVCTTDPAHTKQANVRGNKLISIRPQSQIKLATEKFGPYGTTWGFKTVAIDSAMMGVGLVVFKGTFYYPGGEFEIINSIGIWRDNARTKLDDDFGKKVETDTLTKALSKIGFNADVFLGYFDDHRYVDMLNEGKAKAAALQEKIFEVTEENNIDFIAGIERMLNVCESMNDVESVKKQNGQRLIEINANLPDRAALLKNQFDIKRAHFSPTPHKDF